MLMFKSGDALIIDPKFVQAEALHINMRLSADTLFTTGLKQTVAIKHDDVGKVVFLVLGIDHGNELIYSLLHVKTNRLILSHYSWIEQRFRKLDI